ncbi:MAG: DUF5723 family protein [Flavobacterium sp.]|uniref:DUF5723 family protein n=1 Tax=Flavobacterium sp. TaxID=239 RepID=UPI0026094C06|nr:DUF5723 family protein [Flavobacterium sp.]MDD5150202.1 DUF5723 family protein [Flavobacterium sp.]
MSAQDHFSGMKTSRRVGILNADINPAELSNLSSKYEVNFFSLSFNISNNKVGFSDIVNGNNIEDLIFKGNEPVNMRIDAEIFGPGFAMKINKWSLGLTTKGYAQLNLVDVDPNLGDAINSGINNIIPGSTTIINNDNNQRLNGTSWGEVGFSAARNLFENEKHKLNAGATIKLLFPDSYTNLGLDKFQGTINTLATEAYLNNTQANLNIAYSENLSGSNTNFSDYSKSIFGNLNGFAVDLGLNYRLKDKDDYKINAGLSVRNIGAMTFKNTGNSSTNYNLKIQPTIANPNGLALSQFQNIGSLSDVETILQNDGYLTKTESNTDFKVNLPTILSLYADVKVYSKFYLTLYTQQKLRDNGENNQIITQNVISITPRYSLKNFEVYSAWANNEISGTTGGLGFRAYGFYLGSSSIVTALVSDTKQADFYIGYRLGLR